jgi:hydroxymethylbilane synthase
VIRVGTRGSALALAQTRQVVGLLGPSELVAVESSGPATLDKSRWTRSLEKALLDGSIDIAVHSAKDVPAQRPAGIVTAAVPTREDPSDRICGAGSLNDLAPGSTVGTSSPRRSAQLMAARPDLEVVELRGNVDTRLRKLEQGEVDAVILAAAGLNRLGHTEVGTPLDLSLFTPAAGQGSLLLECREGDSTAFEFAAAANDEKAATELTVERDVVTQLDADCHTALGAIARCDGATVTLEVMALNTDGTSWIRDRIEGSLNEAESITNVLVSRMRAAGVDALLAQTKGEG